MIPAAPLFAWFFAAVLASAPLGPTPVAPGAPRFVQLAAVDGLPADSLTRTSFIDAFREVFAEPQFETEAVSWDGTWNAAAPLANRFRLLEGDPAEDTWTLNVLVGASAPLTIQRHANASRSARRVQIPGLRRSRGMSVALTAQPPDPHHRGTPAEPERFAIVLGSAPDSTAGDPIYMGGGYKFSWHDAGHAAGLLALETLHRHSGDLGEGGRLLLTPARRVDDGR